MPSRRRHGLELGLILLLNELLQFGMRNIPPTTLAVILGQTFLYMDVINVPWEKEDVCISGNSVLLDGDWKRLVLCAFEHGDDMHLYYNMASFLIKGRTLEKRYGSKNFILLLLFLTTITNAMYVVLAIIMSDLMNNESYMKTCAIGFSGVVFALKVLTTHEEPSLKAVMVGIQIPSKSTAWIELLLIHLLVPNSSFMGHLAGILTGIIYCNTFVGKQLDKILYCLTGILFLLILVNVLFLLKLTSGGPSNFIFINICEPFFFTGQKIIHGSEKPPASSQVRSTKSSRESHSSTMR